MARRRDRDHDEFSGNAAKKGGTMSAEQLKRKLRNFPAANLTARIAA
jgi:hypothetical protein